MTKPFIEEAAEGGTATFDPEAAAASEPGNPEPDAATVQAFMEGRAS